MHRTCTLLRSISSPDLTPSPSQAQKLPSTENIIIIAVISTTYKNANRDETRLSTQLYIHFLLSCLVLLRLCIQRQNKYTRASPRMHIRHGHGPTIIYYQLQFIHILIYYATALAWIFPFFASWFIFIYYSSSHTLHMTKPSFPMSDLFLCSASILFILILVLSIPRFLFPLWICHNLEMKNACWTVLLSPFLSLVIIFGVKLLQIHTINFVI